MSATRNTQELVSTADLIAESLRSDILQGKLRSEQPLRQDRIAARFSVSKIPVREALVQLKAEGLVTLTPNRGATVSTVSPAEAEEVYVMSTALETVALRRAIPRLTVADLLRAEDTLGAIDREIGAARLGELNWEFHTTLYDPANLPRLMELIRTLHIGVARCQVSPLVEPGYQLTSQKEHRELLEACRHGNSDLAVAYLSHHLQSASVLVVAYLSQAKV